MGGCGPTTRSTTLWPSLSTKSSRAGGGLPRVQQGLPPSPHSRTPRGVVKKIPSRVLWSAPGVTSVGTKRQNS